MKVLIISSSPRKEAIRRSYVSVLQKGRQRLDMRWKRSLSGTKE